MNQTSSLAAASRLAITYRPLSELIPDPRTGPQRAQHLHQNQKALDGCDARRHPVRPWRAVLSRPAPDHLPRHLLFAIIAYRIQADRFGDLGHETRQLTSWSFDSNRITRTKHPIARMIGRSQFPGRNHPPKDPARSCFRTMHLEASSVRNSSSAGHAWSAQSPEVAGGWMMLSQVELPRSLNFAPVRSAACGRSI